VNSSTRCGTLLKKTFAKYVETISSSIRARPAHGLSDATSLKIFELIFRARPAHGLSDATSLKIFELIFIYRVRQSDRPVHFAAVGRDVAASDSPAKNKNESGPVFIRCRARQVFWDVTVTILALMS
jgi:hypothetical protein